MLDALRRHDDLDRRIGNGSLDHPELLRLELVHRHDADRPGIGAGWRGLAMLGLCGSSGQSNEGAARHGKIGHAACCITFRRR